MPAFKEAWRAFREGNTGAAVGYLWVSQDDVDTGRATDAKINEINEDLAKRGVISPEQQTTAAQRVANGSIGTGDIFRQPGTDVFGGFKEGVREGAQSMVDGGQKAITSTTGGILSFLPWQVYVLAGLWLWTQRKQ